MVDLHATLFVLLLSVATTVSFFIGSCQLFIAFVEDITNDLAILNIGGMSQRSRDKMSKHFLKIIEIHSTVKQLSINIMTYDFSSSVFYRFIVLLHRLVDDFNLIYEPIIYELFIWLLLSIASSLLGFMTVIVEYLTIFRNSF